MQTRIPKSNKIFLLAGFISLFFAVSCVEEYWPNIDFQTDYLLFVEGKITNEPGPYQIKLAKSVAIENFEYAKDNTVSNAIITISDNLGNSEKLTEIEPGTYETAESGIRGIIGRQYKITISTNDGRNYESEFEELLEPIGIESLISNRESRYSHDNTKMEGFQFLVTSESFGSETNYFYWELEETYKYEVPYLVHMIYKGLINGTHVYTYPSKPDTLKYCYQTNKIAGFTFSSQEISSQQLTNLPLTFLPYIDERAKLRYSLKAKQFTISNKANIYLDGFLNQGSGQEGLYLNQPYQIKGNLSNIENPDEVVLGYFLVASASESKRIFVSPPDDVDLYTPPPCTYLGAPDCSETPVVYTFQTLQADYGKSPELLPRYIAREMIFDCRINGPNLLIIFPMEECIDCQTRGGVLNKPDFWID